MHDERTEHGETDASPTSGDGDATVTVHPRRSLSDRLTIVIIVTTWVAIVASSTVSFVDQRDADSSSRDLQEKALRAANGVARQVGASTVQVYLSRVQALEKGVVTALNDGHSVQPYRPLAELDISVADGVAMLTAGAPRRTITDLGNLYGQLQIAYAEFGPPGPSKLTAGARYWGCHALPFGDRAAKDLESVPGVAPAEVLTQSAVRQSCR
jgi:hypothetical protein